MRRQRETLHEGERQERVSQCRTIVSIVHKQLRQLRYYGLAIHFINAIFRR